MENRPYLDFLAELGINHAHPGGFALTKAILAHEHIEPNTKVLEVGCGTGGTSEWIAQEWGCHVTALEPHPLMVQQADERFKQSKVPIRLVQGSAEVLPFEENTFDLVLAESVTAFTNIPVSLKEYYRVMEENGMLIQVEMTAESELDPASTAEIKKLYDVSNVLTESEWREALKTAGFNDIHAFRGEELQKDANHPEAAIDPTSILLSDKMGPKAFQMWLDHTSLMRKYERVLNYRVYQAKK